MYGTCMRKKNSEKKSRGFFKKKLAYGSTFSPVIHHVSCFLPSPLFFVHMLYALRGSGCFPTPPAVCDGGMGNNEQRTILLYAYRVALTSVEVRSCSASRPSAYGLEIRPPPCGGEMGSSGSTASGCLPPSLPRRYRCLNSGWAFYHHCRRVHVW